MASAAGSARAALLALALAACGADAADGVRAAEAAPDPDDPRLVAVFGLLGAGEEERAAELAGEVLADHPGHGRAELLLGLAHYRLRRWGLALPHLEAAARREPPFAGQEGAWYALGWCRFWLGRIEPAREAFERHLALVPGSAEARLGLGSVELECGRPDAAIEHLRAAVAAYDARLEAGEGRVVAEAAEAHARLADALLLRDRPDAARVELEAAVVIWPPHHAAWYKLHRVLLEQGEDERAADALVQHRSWKARAEAEGRP